MVNNTPLGINDGLTMIPMGFGALPRRVDPRDFELGAYQIPVAIPPMFMPDVSDIPVYMQGKYPTCGAYAGAFKHSLIRKYHTGVPVSLSPKYLWDEIKQIDGFPLEDGTDMTSIFKTLSNAGDCLEALLPSDLGNSLQEFSLISNVTTAMETDGRIDLIKNYAFTNNPTMAQIKEAIFVNKAVLALIDIGDGFWLPNWSHVLPIKLGNPVGHHFITLWGYNETQIFFRNSWGTSWGNKGDGFFDSTYVQHVIEMGARIFLPNQFIFTKDLQYGDAGNDVLELQRRLGVVPDMGSFGPITRAAVIKYQKAHNITPAVGFCGVKTRTSLNLS